MLLIFNVLLICLTATPILAITPCDDWDPYKDEKCIKIFPDMLKYEDAMKACHLASADASLLSIRTAEEQAFMENLLYKTRKVVNPLWLEAKFDKVNFKFQKNSTLNMK